MNREDIIQIATESWLTEYGRTLLLRGFDIEINIEELERFAALVAANVRETEFKPDWNNYQQGRADGAADEREACVKIIHLAALEYDEPVWAVEIINDIRERGNT